MIYTAVVEKNTEGLTIPVVPVPVTLNFDTTKIVGKALLGFTGEDIVAEIHTDTNLTDLYPAIKFQSEKGKPNRVIELGVCTNPNIDPRIKPLTSENLKNTRTMDQLNTAPPAANSPQPGNIIILHRTGNQRYVVDGFYRDIECLRYLVSPENEPEKTRYVYAAEIAHILH